MPLPPKQQDDKSKHDKDQAVFDAWLTECSDIRDAVIEGLLANLPSAKND